MTMGELVELELELIRTDLDTQMRVQTSQEVASEYAELMRDGVEFDPITVIYDGRYILADGFTRVAAARMNGYGCILADVTPGTYRDAWLLALQANAKHAQPRTNADRRKAVSVALRDYDLSRKTNVEIARICGVTEGLVRKIKKEIGFGAEPVAVAAEVAAPKESPFDSIVVSDEEIVEYGVEWGHAADVLSRMESESVSLVVTSPPYPGQLGNDMSVSQWFAFMRPVVAQVARVLRWDGVFALNVMFKRNGGGMIDPMLFDIPKLGYWAGLSLWELYAWDKMNPVPAGDMARCEIPGWEPVFAFVKGRDYRFSPLLGEYNRKSLNKLEPGNSERGESRYSSGHSRQNGLGARGTNVIRASNSGGEARLRAKGQSFPPELVERFVLQHTAAGNLVVDPFCGAGTTLAVAARHGRSWYGCDVDMDEVVKARRSVAHASANRKMDR